jgi:hypothetical protein
MENINSLAMHRLGPRHVNEGDAVMFDIDDTLIHSGTGTPIQVMIDLLNMLKILGYRIVIITARPHFEHNITWTKSQLDQNGIFMNELIFCPAHEKTKMKKWLGFNFILSVGDMPTDLGGSKYWIRLPDYKSNF